MLSPRIPGRRRAVLVSLAASLAGAIALAGCDLQEDSDVTAGRVLFIENCGTCHQLAQAATTAKTGPNLDAAFVAARADGSDNDTIEGVVESQIENPRPADPENAAVYMPSGEDLGLTSDEAEDIATYVGEVAGVPGIEPPQVAGGPGAQVFANNGCGGCHTLEAFGSTATTGPNLDDVLAGQSSAEVEESIVDPNAKLSQNFQADVMPADYEQVIPPDDLKLLVDYLLESGGGGNGK